jgi:S-adenosylmethionine-diacylglycerol 3-amino-3-carboxypropyl transferase
MGIVFTRAWEDDRLDAELLAVAPGERVLVVASSGDTALALAAAGAHVTGVDANPDQLRLVALKLAAARVLPPETLHRWFEVGRDPGAPAAYRTLVRATLASDDARYWDSAIGLVASGLHKATGVGRPFARLGWVARLAQPGLARMIESIRDVDAQAEWWRRRARRRLFGPVTHFVMARTSVLAPFVPNPRELERARRGGWSHGLEERIDGVVSSVLVRRHPWWRPAFSGRPADLGDGAAWLDGARLQRLAAAPPRLALVCGDLVEVLRSQPVGSLAAISTSNVPDWLDAAAITSLAAAARRALAPGGRVLVRRIVRPAGMDPFLEAGLEPDPLSDGLVARERTALYEAVDLFRAPGEFATVEPAGPRTT